VSNGARKKLYPHPAVEKTCVPIGATLLKIQVNGYHHLRFLSLY